VAKALPSIGDTRALLALVEALRKEEPFWQARMAEALGWMGGAEAVQVLVEVLRTGGPDAPGGALRALWLAQDAQAVEAFLVAALADDECSVRETAAVLLDSFSNECEFQYLREARSRGFLGAD